MTKLSAFFLVFFLNLSIHASTNLVDIANYLQDISVTIRSEEGSGSGVIFSRKTTDNEMVNFVWTAAHVVADLRTERKVILPDGQERTMVEFKDAKIIKQLIENGRNIGNIQLNAEVVRYSDADTGEDLALLRIRKKNFSNTSVVFYSNKDIPPLGTELYHVGSLLGEMGANSMTSGIYSQQGRLINKTIFDQTTVIAFPGSSGGGVFLKDGQYVGMLVRIGGASFNLIIPIRRIASWAKSASIEWAIDETVPMPTENELRKLPVEYIGMDLKNHDKLQKSSIKKQKP